MADLTQLQATEAVRIVGSDATGLELTPVQSTTGGGLHTNLRDNSGNELGTSANPVAVYDPLDVAQSVQNITTQDIGSATVTGYGGQSFILGNPTAGSAASYVLNSIQTVMVEVLGIWTGTLAIEVSSDGGTTWVPRGIHVVGTGLFSASINANVIGSLNASAKTNVRIRATAAITGTANVRLLYSDNPSNIYVANPIKVMDGSSTTSGTTLTIKAASIAPLATDTAAVVVLSPNGDQSTAANQTTEITSLQLIDDIAHAQNVALNKGVPLMGQLDDTSTIAVTEDAVAVARITAQRAVHTNIRNNAGTELGTTTAPVVVRLGDGVDVSSIGSNGDVKVVDGVRNGGAYGALSSTTANVAIEAKVGASRLTNRKALQITILSTGVYWGLDSSVTISTGTPLANNQVLSFVIDPDSTFQVWLVSASTNRNFRIIELP